ncbi:MAG: acyl-CoA thioesterase [Alphaproteobacteria bacterium]|nr:acyl-CoA thioesterase [Alphaproteobacteria bacterium]MCZ6764801.1 acyl-CoA thioesterase [Alphaproteobacteria bacterium]
MPADTNPSGDIFGGWVLAQMDIAGGLTASSYASGRVATVGIESMTFHQPVLVGDVFCAYADLLKTGTTSMTFRIEAWVVHNDGSTIRVTEGIFTYVVLAKSGVTRPLPEEKRNKGSKEG